MPHAKRLMCSRNLAQMFPVVAFVVAMFALGAGLAPTPSRAGDAEYVGSLDGQLVPNTEGLDQIIFRPFRDLSKVKFATPLESGSNITAGRLYDPIRDKSAILTLLVEPEDEAPVLYADLDLDGTMADNEKFQLVHDEEGNPYIFEATIQLPFKPKLCQFRNCDL